MPSGQERRTEQREIDAVALDASGQPIALGSCKWTSSPIGIAEEALLLRLREHLPAGKRPARHYFYSRSGFDRPLRALAKADPERHRLVTPADLYTPATPGA